VPPDVERIGNPLYAEQIAVPACGQAWILLGSRKNPKPASPGGLSREKCLKMPQNLTPQMRALLGAFLPFRLFGLWRNTQN
jgi:hypothetical protein